MKSIGSGESRTAALTSVWSSRRSEVRGGFERFTRRRSNAARYTMFTGIGAKHASLANIGPKSNATAPRTYVLGVYIYALFGTVVEC